MGIFKFFQDFLQDFYDFCAIFQDFSSFSGILEDSLRILESFHNKIKFNPIRIGFFQDSFGILKQILNSCSAEIQPQ